MKLEITNDFIKKLEKRCKTYLARNFVFEVQEVNVTFYDGVWWHMQLGWGNPEPDSKEFYNKSIIFDDRNYSFDWLCGAIYQMVCMVEEEKDDN